ncbi:hypothetical protein [Streptomyces sp. LBL]|uniref:esterase/lipase family protein n=1 Tax=Streptomyces sp. LBL TaxID=2940562 RepID=UPI0024734B21|nr:hypothetical protein [Streptomyces sp. LBL]
MSEREKLPIVYVRGYAGDTAGINKAVEDPFYGFNEGSTHVRVESDDKPGFYQFESPLLRLHLDEGYKILVEGGQEAYLEAHKDIAPDSIWVERFYDPSASTWGNGPEEFRIEHAAEHLLGFIEKIKDRTHAPRVHLVAHSMGGLVCRCLLQKILPDRNLIPADYVDKLFTYGTPHGGIAFDVGFGLVEKLRDATGVNGADIFGPRRMYQYLTPQADADPDGPSAGWDARAIPDHDGALRPEKVFCLVGTDPTDYDVAHGLSSAAVGVRSDGLVQIENAYVPGAHTSYVHRSHSGAYGLVNSEEGYQNLRRFLFGDHRVDAALLGHRLPERDGVTWQAEVRLSVRGLPVVMHERLASHWCPIQLSDGRADGTRDDADDTRADADGAVPLTTVFLHSDLALPATSQTMRYALHLRIVSLREEHGFLSFGDHLEQTADFDDILVVDIGSGPAGPEISASWNSLIPGAIAEFTPIGTRLRDEDSGDGVWSTTVALPGTAAPILGSEAAVRLTATSWD